MPEIDVNKSTAIFAAIGVMVMVPMFFLVMPIYVGALVDDYGYDNAQVGYLLSIELGAAALASLSALFWIRRVDWRKTVFGFLVVLAAANLLSILADGDYTRLQVVRAIAGLSVGVLMSVALAALGDTDKQDRNFGFGVVGQLSVSGVLLLLLPFFTQRWGAASVFSLFLLASVVVMLLVNWLPAGGKKTVTTGVKRTSGFLPLWGLAGGAAIYVGQSAVWAFIERMGVAAGLAAPTIGLALGMSVLAGLGGALAASWLADRKGRLAPMIIAMLGEVASLLFLFGNVTAAVFIAVVVAYSVFWNFWLPYQMAAIAARDYSGRFVALITFAQAAGIATGPAIVGPLIGDGNYDPVVWTGIGFAVLAMVLFLPVTISGRRQAETPAKDINQTSE